MSAYGASANSLIIVRHHALGLGRVGQRNLSPVNDLETNDESLVRYYARNTYRSSQLQFALFKRMKHLHDVRITFEAHQDEVQKPFSSRELSLLLKLEGMVYYGHSCWRSWHR